jgi:hypothetical protein
MLAVGSFPLAAGVLVCLLPHTSAFALPHSRAVHAQQRGASAICMAEAETKAQRLVRSTSAPEL